jgi:hypothetical protein
MFTICEHCAYYSATDDDLGNCHRNAPRPALVMVQAIKDHPENITAWPTVARNNWCGEWEPSAPLPIPDMPLRLPLEMQQPPTTFDGPLTYELTNDIPEEGL